MVDPATPIGDALSVRAATTVERAIRAAGVGSASAALDLATVARLTERELRAMGAGRATMREVVTTLSDAGLALAVDARDTTDAERDVWTVRGIIDKGPRIEVTLEVGRDRVTLPTTETPRVRVGDRVRIGLRRVRA